MTDEISTAVKILDPHPACLGAIQYLNSILSSTFNFLKYKQMFEGMPDNKQALICLETMVNLFSGKDVSDGCLLGLAWTIRDIEDQFKEAQAMIEKMNKTDPSTLPVEDVLTNHEVH